MKVQTLKVGDRFFEASHGQADEFEVVSEVITATCDYDGRTQFRWSAKHCGTGEIVLYMVTEGLEHYGPRIYDHNPYL